ncbi:YphA family membrane protein [Neobacillus sp. D3-1R]|uniref:YphA family membrane protein n=1 Tax=Neobacillus sp. D3-1R TaxID=3445778 RepID=UPI003FA0D4E9
MEGLYFYSISWSIWIVCTFFLNKKFENRFPLAFITLFIIILSPYNFTLQNITISYAAVGLLIICLFQILSLAPKGKFYFFLTSLIIAVGYVAFQLFELFDPVWIVMKRDWMLSLLLTYLILMLQSKLIWRITSVITGCIYGEILFALAIRPYSFPQVIGSMVFLDVCSLTLLMLFAWTSIKVTISFFENYYQSIEGEKQKTT